MRTNKKEYVMEKIGKEEIQYFESVGMKLPNESISNFLYRLRIEHQRGVGGFGRKIFVV